MPKPALANLRQTDYSNPMNRKPVISLFPHRIYKNR